MDLNIVTAGLLVGTVIGATGMGGGSLMTPVLVWLFGVAPIVAIGTNLWFSALTKLIGGSIYIRRGSVDWTVLRRLSLGSIPSAIIALWIIHILDFTNVPDSVLMGTLGLVLLLTSAVMLFKPWLLLLCNKRSKKNTKNLNNYQRIATIIMGGVLGITVSFTSIGAGTLGSVILVYLYPLRINTRTLVGTDIIHAIPLTLVAGVGYLLMGQINFAMLGCLLIGSIPGIIIGSFLGARVPDTWLRFAITSVMFIIGSKMILA